MNEYFLEDLKNKPKQNPLFHLDLSSFNRLAFNDLPTHLEKHHPNSLITILDMSRNFLVKLPGNLFNSKEFMHITNLNLSRNQLLVSNEKPFASLVSLTHLDLSYNNIGLEPDNFLTNKFNGLHGLFDMNKSLRYLNLSHNFMKRLAVDAFYELSELNELDLSSNELNDLNYKEINEDESICISDESEIDVSIDENEDLVSLHSKTIIDQNLPMSSCEANSKNNFDECSRILLGS
jgi:Leucine-rich repeat (LRR) protein